MRTITDNLQAMADDIQHLLGDLLLNHSEIYRWHTPSDTVSVVSARGYYAYRELKQEGRQLQAQLLEKYRRLYALLTVLLKDQPKDTLKDLSQADTVMMRTIEQDHTGCTNTQEALNKVGEALAAELNLLNRLYDASGGEATYIPDTNALIHNPDLESWTFSETPKFTIVLLPTVLSELDVMKVNYRIEEVRKKAEKIIRKIKDYKRRGRLMDGVPLRDKNRIQAVAVEPDMEASLPWLDKENNDDRLLAGVIEVIRARPRSPVSAVSRDINFQNKAEFANVPCEEPPELAKEVSNSPDQ